MADDSMDVDNFTGGGANDSIDVDAVSGGGGYIDDDIDIDDDDDDDEDDDDDTPLVVRVSNAKPTSGNGGAPMKGRPGHIQNKHASALPPLKQNKKHMLTSTSTSTSKAPSQDDYKPGDYKLRACGMSEDVREFIIAKFRDGLPEMNQIAGTNEQLKVTLYRNGERTVEKRKDGLKQDLKSRNFIDSYRGQRREIRRHKQGFATIRERLLRDWKLEIAPNTVHDKLVAEHQNRIQRRLNNGMTKGMPLDAHDKDVDEEDDDDNDNDNDDNDNDKDDNGDNDSENNNDKDKDKEKDNDKDKDKTDKDNDNDTNMKSENEEPTLKELKKLVKKYTGQFDGRTSSTKFAFMIMNDDTKIIDVIPVSDTSMFVFRSDQKATAKSAEEVEKIHKKLRTKRMKDERLKHFSDTALAKQTERDILMGDRNIIENMPNAYNAGIGRAPISAEDMIENDTGEDFDFEQEFDNDDLLQVDREEVTKTPKSAPIDIEEQKKAFQKLIKDMPDSPASSDNSNNNSDVKKEEDQLAPTSTTNTTATKNNTGNVKTVQQSSKDIKKSPGIMSPSPSLSPSQNSSSRGIKRTSPGSGSGSGSNSNSIRQINASPSSGSNRKGTPQMLDLKHLLPPPGTLPTADHVKAVLRELLHGRKEVSFRELIRYFERKTQQQKTNLIKRVQEIAEIKKTGKSIIISWKK